MTLYKDVVRLLCVLLLVASCVDRGPGPQRKKIEHSYIRGNLITQLPAGVQTVNVDLGGKVVYVGTRLTTPEGTDLVAVAPGQKFRITHYWQVKQPVGTGWRIFRLLRGAPNSADFMNLDPTDMEIGHPPHKWKAGQLIQDVQDVVLRPDWRSPSVRLLVGLIADEGHQLGDRMVATGTSVVDRAVIARDFVVDLSKAPPPPGTIHLPRATGPITIDGIATEPGWAGAATSTELVTADGSPEPVGRSIARMTWDDQNLYVFVQITDTDVFSQYKQHDEPIWKQDCVEMFIDADGNRRGYVELQVNPNNTRFDSFFAGTRAQPGDESWTSNMQTAVMMRGTADKGGDLDQGWDVEIAIPLASVKGRDDAMAVQLPPQIGDRWRLNIVRVDYRSNGGNPAVSSWNRISYGDFHALDRMLTVVFADPTGSITPQGEGAPAAGSGSAGSAAAPGATGGSAGSAAPAAAGSASAVPPPPRPSGSAAPPAAGSASAVPPPPRPTGSAAPPLRASGSAAQPPSTIIAPGLRTAPPSPAGSAIGSGSAVAPAPVAPPASGSARP